MKRIFPTLVLLAITFCSQAQKVVNKPYSGMISLGMRSTVSLFSHDENEFGLGYGGQVRIQFNTRLNSDWFADYIRSQIGTQGYRVDGHIGWSVLFYPINEPTFTRLFKPYILAGHCFDYTRVVAGNYVDASKHNYAERWSAAVQAGLGTHINITSRCDISLTSQYMIHLGNDIDYNIDPETNQLLLVKKKGSALEGHLLLTVSANFKLGELW